MAPMPSDPTRTARCLVAALALAAVTGCGDNLEPLAADGGSDGGSDAAGCQWAPGDPQSALPDGIYRVETLAHDWAACGLPPLSDPPPQFFEVRADETSLTISPESAAALVVERCGETLSSTCDREYRVHAGADTCILAESDTVTGASVADGSLWLEVSFTWEELGGACDLLRLPCDGEQTWQLDWNGPEIPDGLFTATVTAIELDGCSLGYEIGTTNDYAVTAEPGSMELCPAGTGCFTLERNLLTLTGSRGPVDIGTCMATVDIEGTVVSADEFVLYRTYTGQPCPCISRIVQTFVRS